jgi:O-succinylbenzoate synthase
VRIEQLDLYHVAMPMTEVWRTGCGDETAIQSVIVRMTTDAEVGWAETAPHRGPLYSPEWADGVYSVIRDWLGPMVLGHDVASGDELQALMSTVRANQFAKAGLDVAWWDAHARSTGKAMWQVIGGAAPVVEAGADLGVKDTIEELLETIAAAVDTGFKRIKLKYRPGWDLFMLRAVRERFPDQVFHIDCNSSYTLDDLPMFREIDRFGLAMIEQPLRYDDLLDHAKLQAEIRTPVCLDESINSLHRTRHAIELKSCQWINIKVGRTGGLTPALAIHNLCREHGIPNWIGNMLESALGQAPSLAMATLPNVKYPSDVFPSSRFYVQDLCDPQLELSGPSEATAPDRPGLGWIPNPERLAQVTLKHTTLRPQ